VTVASVALGKSKEYRKITYGLTKPPEGFHSCHGVRGSEFADDEYVVYDTRQQRIDYLVELTA
jgi:poly [ADP-ribose] polymerase